MKPLSWILTCSLLFGVTVLSAPHAWAKDAPAAKEETSVTKPQVTKEASNLEKLMENGKEYAVISTKHGDILLELYRDAAPKHVEALTGLMKKGFYNGLTFHRVVPGFVAQGGDPTGTGTGNAGFNLPLEISAKKHVKGALGMARSGDPNSASCQFYITLAPTPNLDGQYTVWGLTTSGMDAVEKIKVGDKMDKVTYYDKRK